MKEKPSMKDGSDDPTYSAKISKLQMSLVTQLFQIGANANHIDELFQWLAYAIADHFDVQLIQFWISHVNRMGQLNVQLRTMVCQDNSLPSQVVVNDQVATVVQRIAAERQSSKLLAVDNMFLHYQAALFKRYGLNYCMSYFLNKNVLIPAQQNSSSPMASPAPLAMTSLFLLRQSPHMDLLPIINTILNQAISVASNRGLLLSMSEFGQVTPFQGFPSQSTPFQGFPSQSTPFQGMPAQEALPTLAELIPHRKQDANMLTSSNPFSSSTVIADKRARRFYVAVDGHTSVAGICNSIHMDLKDAHVALQLLLVQQRIELYGPGGRLVNPSLFFKDL
jgi:hypothetical protein